MTLKSPTILNRDWSHCLSSTMRRNNLNLSLWSTGCYNNFKIFTSKTVWWNTVLLLLYVRWGHFFFVVLTCGVLFYKLVGLGFQVLILLKTLMTHCSHSQVVNSGSDFCVMSALGIFQSIICTLMNEVNLSRAGWQSPFKGRKSFLK